jgi:hypothetical protein
MTAILIPAAVGMMGMVQQPALLKPLQGMACNDGETLVSRSAHVVVRDMRSEVDAHAENIIWTACITPESSRVTYLPMFTLGAGLFLLFLAANRLGRYAFALSP